MKIYEFDAEIKKKEGMDAAFIEFPYNVEAEFGVKGQVKVSVTFDGYGYRGSLAKMGHHCHLLGITKNIRDAIGKQPGDVVHIVLKRDDEPRVVDIPEDLMERLEEDKEVHEFFNRLSYTNQKSYVNKITSAKKEETRAKRLDEAIVTLRNKINQS